jgi:Holliday junction resolvasome RuvABC endonuclease subunit
MRVLGIDPGLRHTGWAVIDDKGRAVAKGTIVPPGRGRIQPHEVLEYVLDRLCYIIAEFVPDVAVVEQVAWYGRGRRITLPLAHVAGGIAGFLLGRYIPVHLLLAAQKNFVCRRKGWTEHEKDAYVLAIVVQKAVVADGAAGSSTRRKPSAVVRRKITAPRIVHGKL